jgi:hypothetical protein
VMRGTPTPAADSRPILDGRRSTRRCEQARRLLIRARPRAVSQAARARAPARCGSVQPACFARARQRGGCASGRKQANRRTALPVTSTRRRSPSPALPQTRHHDPSRAAPCACLPNTNVANAKRQRDRREARSAHRQFSPIPISVSAPRSADRRNIASFEPRRNTAQPQD